MVGSGASMTVKSRLSSRPCFFSPAFMAMSTPAPIALVASTLPLRSAIVLMPESLRTKNWLLK